MSFNESLSKNSNYPPMSQSDWDRAPWNEVEVPERDFDVYCSQTLSKTVNVRTNNYIDLEDEIDTQDTDWASEYSKNHYTPEELLKEFRKFLKKEILSYEKDLYDIIHNPKRTSEVADRIRYLAHLEHECENWIVTDCEIGEE